MTDMCVTGMTRELADSGFEIIVPSDACATFAESSHEWSIQFLGSTFATTAKTDAVIDVLKDCPDHQPKSWH
jgi:nicotinamidase-related amidase